MSTMPCLIEFHACELDIDFASLEILSKHTPFIQLIRGDINNSFMSDFGCYSGFTHLTEIEIGPQLEDIDESAHIISLCKNAKHLPIESLRFFSWCLSQTDSWCRLSQSFPHLHQLTLHHMSDQICLLLDESVNLIKQLTHIEFAYCTKDSIDFLFTRVVGENLLAHLHSLHVLYSTPRGTTNPQMIYQLFNDPTFYHQLEHLIIRDLSIDIMYDVKESKNQCLIDNDLAHPLRLNRHARVEVPPAPRLVGIELNPGPPSSSSSSSSSSFSSSTSSSSSSRHGDHPSGASTLFNDGMILVFSFLTTFEWNECARTSRRWFHIASTCNKREICLIKSIVIPKIEAKTFYIGLKAKAKAKAKAMQQILSQKTTTNSTPSTTTNILKRVWRSIFNSKRVIAISADPLAAYEQPRISWTLRHRITSAQFVGSLIILPRVVTLLSNIRTITIIGNNDEKEEDSEEGKGVHAFRDTIRSFIFPHSVTSLDIQSTQSSYVQPLLDMFATTFRGTQPRSVIMNGVKYAQDPVGPSSLLHLSLSSLRLDLDFSPLVRNSHICMSLRSLKLVFNVSYLMSIDERTEQSAKLMEQLSRLIQLTSLELSTQTALNEFALSHMSLMPHLQQFDCPTLVINSHNLALLQSVTPEIEILRGNVTPGIDLASYTPFNRLTELTLNNRPTRTGVDGVNAAVMKENEIIESLCSLNLPLVRISFRRWFPHDEVSWVKLASKFPHLTHLDFESCYDRDPLMSVVKVDTFIRRLRHLSFVDCDSMTDLLFSEGSSPRRLTHLTLYRSPLPRQLTPTLLLQLLRQQEFMSHLKELMLEQDNIRVMFSRERNLNRCFIRENDDDEEEQQHQIKTIRPHRLFIDDEDE